MGRYVTAEGLSTLGFHSQNVTKDMAFKTEIYVYERYSNATGCLNTMVSTIC
jgi:hypothetical protein